MQGPPGKIGHAELKIGGSTVNIFLYVKDVDAAFKQAVNAGAKAETPPADMFRGDRYGKLTDPFGHAWSPATHKEDVTPAEMQKRSEAAMSGMTQKTRTASESQ